MKTLRRGIYPLAFLFCLFIAAFVSPYASSLPDGLESVSANLGFKEKEITGINAISIAPDYLFPGVSGDGRARGVAGALGVVTALVAGAGAGYLMTTKKRR